MNKTYQIQVSTTRSWCGEVNPPRVEILPEVFSTYDKANNMAAFLSGQSRFGNSYTVVEPVEAAPQ